MYLCVYLYVCNVDFSKNAKKLSAHLELCCDAFQSSWEIYHDRFSCIYTTATTIHTASHNNLGTCPDCLHAHYTAGYSIYIPTALLSSYLLMLVCATWLVAAGVAVNYAHFLSVMIQWLALKHQKFSAIDCYSFCDDKNFMSCFTTYYFYLSRLLLTQRRVYDESNISTCSNVRLGGEELSESLISVHS